MVSPISKACVASTDDATLPFHWHVISSPEPLAVGISAATPSESRGSCEGLLLGVECYMGLCFDF